MVLAVERELGAQAYVPLPSEAASVESVEFGPYSFLPAVRWGSRVALPRGRAGVPLQSGMWFVARKLRQISSRQLMATG